MPHEIDHFRRRFLGSAAMTLAAPTAMPPRKRQLEKLQRLSARPDPIAKLDSIFAYRTRRGVQEETDSILLVQFLNETAQFDTQNLGKGNGALPDDGYLEPSIAQRSGHFQPDKTGADHRAGSCSLCFGDDRFAVGQSPEPVHVRQVCAFDR